jgi:hypothetical protein
VTSTTRLSTTKYNTWLPPAISVIATASEEHENHNDNQNGCHSFLQNIHRATSIMHMGSKELNHQPRNLPSAAGGIWLVCRNRRGAHHRVLARFVLGIIRDRGWSNAARTHQGRIGIAGELLRRTTRHQRRLHPLRRPAHRGAADRRKVMKRRMRSRREREIMSPTSRSRQRAGAATSSISTAAGSRQPRAILEALSEIAPLTVVRHSWAMRGFIS